MTGWYYDSEMGGYISRLCDRCGTAKGVRSTKFGDLLCPPCERVWDGEGKEYDDHHARNEERRQMGYGNL